MQSYTTIVTFQPHSAIASSLNPGQHKSVARGPWWFQSDSPSTFGWRPQMTAPLSSQTCEWSAVSLSGKRGGFPSGTKCQRGAWRGIYHPGLPTSPRLRPRFAGNGVSVGFETRWARRAGPGSGERRWAATADAPAGLPGSRAGRAFRWAALLRAGCRDCEKAGGPGILQQGPAHHLPVPHSCSFPTLRFRQASSECGNSLPLSCSPFIKVDWLQSFYWASGWAPCSGFLL